MTPEVVLAAAGFATVLPLAERTLALLLLVAGVLLVGLALGQLA